MNDISPKKICGCMPEEDLKRVIDLAYQKDKKSLCKVFGKNVQQYFQGGFRDISKVSNMLIKNKIGTLCIENEEFAITLLKCWFQANEKLKGTVSDNLKARSYNPVDPDFFNLNINELKSEDIIRINDKDYFKCPNYDKIIITELFDITLMAALLGWFPQNNNKKDEIKNVQTTNVSLEKEKFLVHEIDELEELIKNYAIKKEGLNDLLNNIKNEIAFDNFESLKIIEGASEIMLNTIKEVRGQLNAVEKNLRRYFTENIYKHTDEGLSDFKEYDDANNIASKLKLLKSKYVGYVKIENESCSEKIKEAYEMIEDLNQEQKEKFLSRIKLIENGLESNKLENIISSRKQADIIILEIEEEINNYDLSMAKNDLKNQKNINKATKFILNFFFEKGEPEDIFIFLALFAKIDYSVDDKFYAKIVSVFVDLINRYGQEFILILAKSFKDCRQLHKNESFKIIGLLLAFYSYFIKEKEIAATILFTDNIGECVNNSDELSRFEQLIMNQEDVEFIYTPGKEKINGVEDQIDEIFRKEDGKFVHLINGVDHKYQLMESTEIIPVLYNEYITMKHSNEPTIIEIILKLGKSDYSKRLFKEAISKKKLPDNFVVEKKITKSVDKTKELLIELGNHIIQTKSKDSFSRINVQSIVAEINKLIAQYPLIEEFAKIITDRLSVPLNGTGITTKDPSHFTNSFIISSRFFGINFPETLFLVNSNELSTEDIFLYLIDETENSYSPDVYLRNATDNYCFIVAKKIKESFGIDETEIDVKELQFLEKINKLKSEIKNYSRYEKRISDLELLQRNKLLIEELKTIKEKEDKLLITTSQQSLDDLGKISQSATKQKLDLYDERHKFNPSMYKQIVDGLSVIEQAFTNKEINKKPTCEKILDEIKHLCQFRDDSTEHLINLIDECNSSFPEEQIQNQSCFTLDLIDILKFIEDDKYEELGLSKKQWTDISSDRKEDMINLLQAWIFLKDKPSDRGTIFNDKYHKENLNEEYKTLFNSLSRICTLYRTNENNRIGQDPLMDWERSQDLPFTFCTKIQQPRCESLDRQIRLFCFTEYELKKNLLHVREYILDNSLDKNSFSVAVILGDRQKFDSMSTSKVTSNLPMLDETYLKKILFSVYHKKAPKWEFVSLLTLNRSITTIHPFRSEGSINSEIGIFVGRSDIIQEITSNSKDYAIFGGRRIGKSSLLNEVKRELEKKNYITTYQSLMSNPDSLYTANSILVELKSKGCRIDRKLPLGQIEEFKGYMKEIYLANPSRNIAILFDEVDDLIVKEKEIGRHLLIEMCRDLSNETEHHIKFVFAGFKEMYLEIHNKGIYEKKNSPWRNFIEDTSKKLAEIDSPRELINEGLQNILGLEFDDEVVKWIEKYSSGHPAFLQMFCTRLVTSIANRITPFNRKIYTEDVHRVFKQESEFINFVYDTLDSNLSNIQNAIIFIAALEKKQEFSNEWISEKLHSYVDLYDKDLVIPEKTLNLELELLEITGVIKPTSKQNDYRFSHEYYIEIINQLDRINKDVLENLISKIIKQERLTLNEPS